MPDLIKGYDNHNETIVDFSSDHLMNGFFNLVKLGRGEAMEFHFDEYETVWTVLQGNASFRVGLAIYEFLGQRNNIWSGVAESFYVPVNASVFVQGNAEDTVIAVGGGICKKQHAPFAIRPEEVKKIRRGSDPGHTHWEQHLILGERDNDETGALRIRECFLSRGQQILDFPHTEDAELVLYHQLKGKKASAHVQIHHQYGLDTHYEVKNGDILGLEKGIQIKSISTEGDLYIFAVEV